MKLKAREQELPSRQLTIDLPGKGYAALEDYVRYYEATHGHALEIEPIAADIIVAFIATDYDFTKWRRDRSGKAVKKPQKVARTPARGPSASDSGEAR